MIVQGELLLKKLQVSSEVWDTLTSMNAIPMKKITMMSLKKLSRS